MRAEKRRHKFNRGRLVQLTNDAQNFQLFVQREAVAGLGLHRCRAAAQEPVCALLRLREKLRFAGRARLAHRRTDSSTTRGDLFVGRAARAHFEFIDPIPAEDGMGMRIDKTRQDDAAAGINHFDVVRQLPRDFVRRAGGGDHAIAHQHPAVLDDGEIAQFTADARPFRAGERHQLGSV